VSGLEGLSSRIGDLPDGPPAPGFPGRLRSFHRQMVAPVGEFFADVHRQAAGTAHSPSSSADSVGWLACLCTTKAKQQGPLRPGFCSPLMASRHCLARVAGVPLGGSSSSLKISFQLHLAGVASWWLGRVQQAANGPRPLAGERSKGGMVLGGRDQPNASSQGAPSRPPPTSDQSPGLTFGALEPGMFDRAASIAQGGDPRASRPSPPFHH